MYDKEVSPSSFAEVRAARLPLRWLPLAWFSLFFLAFVLGGIGAAINGDPMAMCMQWLGVRSPALIGIALHEIGMMMAVGILFMGLKNQGISVTEIGLRRQWSGQMISYGVASAVITFVPTLLTLRFKSLYPAILMHTLNNLFAYLVVPWL